MSQSTGAGLGKKLGTAIAENLAFFKPTRRSVAFALRATISALLALGAAMALGFKEIGWAPITVWVLALPRRGMVTSKAFHRIFGTLIGAGAAFVFLTLEHHPFLFLFLMCLWLGLCAAASNLLKNHQAYAAQLAGFTAPIVAVLVHGHAGSSQELALERVVCVLLGIAASTLVTLIFAKPVEARDVEDEARALASHGVKWASDILEKSGDDATAFNHGLLARIADLDQFSESAAVESSAIRVRLGAVRRLISSVLSLVSAARAIERVRLLVGETEDVKTAAAVLRGASEKLGEGAKPVEAIATLKSLGEGACESVAHQVVRDRLTEISSGIRRISGELDLILTGPTLAIPSPPLAFHRDWQKARGSAWRTFLATMVVGSIWIHFEWHGGSIAFIMAALACVIFGNKPLPAAGVRRFSVGVGMAALAFVIWKAVPLSHGASMSTTVAVMVVLTFIGAIALANNVQQGMDFNANVSQLMVGPASVLVGAGPAAIAGLDILAGIGVAYLAFSIPPGAERRREQQLSASILADLERLAHDKWHPPAHEWESIMYDRLYQSGLATAGPNQSKKGLRHCLLGLDMGLEILRLHALVRSHSLDEEGSRLVSESLAVIHEDALETTTGILSSHADALLATSGPPDTPSRARLQAAGALKTLVRCRALWNPQPS